MDDPKVEYQRKNETGVDIGVYAPLLIHPVEHFFFGIGPLLRYDHLLSQDSSIPRTPNSITVAANSTIGGWF